MKYLKLFKWKIFALTGAVCLLPIVPGLILWDRLPESVPIHFDINNNPDNFASKGFFVFAMPAIMVLFQFISCLVCDINNEKHGESKRFTAVAKWIIPVLTVLLQTMTFAFSLGYKVDIRVGAVLIVGCMFIALGNYLPKLNYVKNYKIDTVKARKINRFTGISMVILGALFIVSAFLPTIFSVICLCLLIPYSVVLVCYMAYVIKKK